jgi:photosystem II stability/assembly factor-like uncharacterized protein
MKTLKFYLPVLLTLLLLPVLLKAQWSAVRWDQSNNFRKVFAVTSNTAFVIGTAPVNTEYFILRTNDGGATWDSIAVNTVSDTFLLTEVFFLDMNTGFVGGLKNGGQVLLKTTSTGNNWTDITPSPFSSSAVISVSFIDAQKGFATDGTTLYATTDGGMNWSSNIPAFSLSDLTFFDMNIGFSCGEDAGDAVVMKTTDGGQSWNTSFTLPDIGSAGISFNKLDFISTETGFTSHANKLYRTQDGGSSWYAITAPNAIWDFDFTTSPDTGHILTRHGSWGPDSSDLCTTVDGGQNWNMEYTTGWNFYGGGVTLNSISFIEQTGYASASSGLIKKYDASSVGINSNEALNSTISLYPNPFSSSLLLNAGNNSNGDWHLNIYDKLGQLIYNTKLSANQMRVHIPADLRGGIYFYKLTSDRSVIKTGKIIKQ